MRAAVQLALVVVSRLVGALQTVRRFPRRRHCGVDVRDHRRAPPDSDELLNKVVAAMSLISEHAPSAARLFGSAVKVIELRNDLATAASNGVTRTIYLAASITRTSDVSALAVILVHELTHAR